MRPIVICLAMVICLAGCKKSNVAPQDAATRTVTTSTDFSVTSDSPNFSIPCNINSGAKEIILRGTITTTLSPEATSYVIMSLGDSSIWHSSFMAPVVDFRTKNIRGLIHGSTLDLNLSFYQIASVNGPITFEGKIDYIAE